MQRCIICGHKFARVRKAGQGSPPKARTTEIEPRLAMTIGEGVNEGRQLQTRSHSFSSRRSGSSSPLLAIMTILPSLSISTRAICTPAAATALTALVTSCCRNVEGARAMVRKSAYGRSCGAPAKRTAWLEVVEAVAYRAERGLVVPAVNRDRAGRVLDRSCGLGERHHPPALQQPNQAGLVVAGQASVARVRLGRRLVEAEQVL